MTTDEKRRIRAGTSKVRIEDPDPHPDPYQHVTDPNTAINTTEIADVSNFVPVPVTITRKPRIFLPSMK
jgi:hypothetical protein